ncbi:hypothetical protein PP175_20895 [Aneurinibacillus sp. Ricciae_BoGa-3]|uniref:hypothetical protein n=1 Tax=Aneurinibacillus sp. Ricciae_BoGa-3 TaxID=3022697 RepID=UPI002341FDE4|nr:hypothetical protein [Aneurinibacillus sp. Ricciae_BoGa-3]WCK53753.1 hypothetical protein PP175_20895 [Aneurinibacillus sp. Ricciae_BoGa-3]
MKLRMVVNTLYKLVFFPAVLVGMSASMPGILSFSGVLHLAFVCILLTIIGVLADETILPLFGVETSTIQGAGAIMAILYLSGILFPGSNISVSGAVFAGAALGIIERVAHHFVMLHRRATT